MCVQNIQLQVILSIRF